MVNKFLIKFFLLFAFANLSIQFSAAMESDNKQVNVPNLNAINAVELPVINAENPNISYMFMERFLARHSEYSSGKVFVFDTETTGATYEDKIIQITILEFLCGKFTGRIFNRYFNPARDSSILAYKAHGISASELAQESTFGEVFPHIRAFLGENPTMLAYNSPFDARMLKAEIERMPHDDSVEVVTFDFFHKDIRQILQRDLKRFLTGFKVESPEKKQVRCKQKSAADLLLERESRLLNNTVSYIDGAIKSNSRDSQLPWGNQVAFIESVRKDIDQATLRKNSPLWLSRYHQEIDIYDKISESLVRDRRISEENNIKKLKEFEKKAFWSKKRLKRLTARMSSLSRHISEKKLNKNSSEYKPHSILK